MQNPWDNLKDAPPASLSGNMPVSTPQKSLPQTALPQTALPQTALPQTALPQPSLQNDASSSPSAFSSSDGKAKSSGGRGTAFFLIALGLGLTIFDWYLLKAQHEYYVKAAVLGPLCAVLGFVGLPFPDSLNKDTDDKVSKIARIAAIGGGAAAGCLNWYLLAN